MSNKFIGMKSKRRSFAMDPISNKSDLINLKMENSQNKKYILVFILLLFFSSFNFMSLYFKSSLNK